MRGILRLSTLTSLPSQTIPVTTEQPETVRLQIQGSSVDLLMKQCASKGINCMWFGLPVQQ